jgi:hypothetical protein
VRARSPSPPHNHRSATAAFDPTRWSPTEGTIQRDATSGFSDVVDEASDRLRAGVGSIPGVVIEPKKASVAVHCRLVDPDQHNRIASTVATMHAEQPDRLKVTPGKMRRTKFLRRVNFLRVNGQGRPHEQDRRRR